jgi:hypothetical protein
MKRHLKKLGFEDTRYLAGIWNSRLPQALVWNVSNAEVIRPDAYRAPTWSWAAVDGPVNMHDYRAFSKEKLELLATVTGATTAPINPNDDTGPVSGGVITLKGTLFAADLRPYVKEEVVLAVERIVQTLSDLDTGEILAENPPIGQRKDGGPKWAHWSVTFDTKEDACDKVLCLPVTRHEAKYANGSTYWDIVGLALRKDAEGYRRVGLLGLDVREEAHVSPVFEKVEVREVNIV